MPSAHEPADRAATPLDVAASERPTRSSRRAAHRAVVVTYRVRIDLLDTDPQLWRRLELASDLFLDEIHEIIQTAFGWTDSHLHRFASGPDFWSHESEHYLCQFEVDEGDQGVAEANVRLDEVITEVGDELLYLYDFGDDWLHTITLEAVEPREESTPRAVCTAGQRPGPPEDCGGVGGYELVAAATDPAHDGHGTALAELARMFGGYAEAFRYTPVPLDTDLVNHELADITGDRTLPRTELSKPVVELLDSVRSPRAKRTFRALLDAARLDEPVEVDTETAHRMVYPYLWLLDRVGTDGITLTKAGYLPPRHVEAAMAVVDPHGEWIGKGNREDLTPPVLNLRESAQRLGLLRKYKGTLLVTRHGSTLRDDPVAMWTYLAQRTPPPRAEDVEQHAGVLLLASAAAQVTENMADNVAGLLSAIGWVDGEGRPLTGRSALSAAPRTAGLLRQVGAFTHDHSFYRRERPAPDGVTFARAALTNWLE